MLKNILLLTCLLASCATWSAATPRGSAYDSRMQNVSYNSQNTAVVNKATGNGGGNECHSAERAFFNIVKKNKHGFLPDHTADARKSFLLECDSAGPAIISQIISKFGRMRG